ncbi:MAG: SpoIIIAH-like family protein [bacterium]|nr:SpoIIIAH-like family protein [bacterium]MDY4098944.1 SpoIIIAH-like family protein [Lachnospiraceae bacterium]
MKIFKKNQMIITALALMIAAAGYVSYTYGNKEDLTAATSKEVAEDTYDISEEDALLDDDIFTDTEDPALDTAQAEEAGQENTEEASVENPGETVLTGAVMENVNFAVEMKMNREQVRSENKESLLAIIDSETLSDAQKQDAIDKMVALTDIAEKEAAAEMLLEAKGFTDVVVSISSDGGADVVLDMGEVTDAKRAQIEDIVSRKADIAAEKIVITPITAK